MGLQNPVQHSELNLTIADGSEHLAVLGSLIRGLGNKDRVILVGDVRQYQSVEAGRIFEELQKAGMKTAQLNKVVRQKDEDLKRAVILMGNGRIADGVDTLQRQGRVHEVAHRADRFAAIAKAYAENPENTLVVSPDNKSRQEINSAIRDELKRQGKSGLRPHVSSSRTKRCSCGRPAICTFLSPRRFSSVSHEPAKSEYQNRPARDRS